MMRKESASLAGNIALENDVRQQLKAIAAEQAEIENHAFHIETLKKHLRNIHTELEDVQKVLRSKQRDHESELNLCALLRSERAALQKDIDKMKLQIAHYSEINPINQNKLSTLQQALQNILDEIEWDQQRLETWLNEAVQKEDDLTILRQFCDEDNAKINDLNAQISALSSEVNEKKKAMDNTTMELKVTKVALEKITEEYRIAQHDRQKITTQWEKTVQKMHQRDVDIEKCISEIVHLKREINQMEVLEKEEQYLLQAERKKHNELKEVVQSTERNIATLKQTLLENEKTHNKCQTEVETLNSFIRKSNSELQKMQFQMKVLTQDIDKKHKRFQTLCKECEELEQKANLCVQSTQTSEEKLQKFMVTKEAEETQLENLLKELKSLQELYSSRSREMEGAQEQERLIQADIQALQSMFNTLHQTRVQLEEGKRRQENIMKAKEKEIECLTEKIGKLETSGNGELQNKALECRLQHFKVLLEDRTTAYNILKQEVKQQQDEIRKVQKELGKLIPSKSNLESKLDDINLHNDNAEKSLNELTTEKQKLMVKENLLKLEIHRMHEVLSDKTKATFSKEKYKQQLQLSLRDRQGEINSMRNALSTEVRLIDDDILQLSRKLNEQLAKLSGLRTRYDSLLAPIKFNRDDDISEIDFIIKTTEDNEVLGQQISEMRNKIEKAEADVQSFSVASQQLNDRNAATRRLLKHGPQFEEESDIMQQLDEQLAGLIERKKFLNDEIQEMEDELAKHCQEMQLLNDDRSEIEVNLKHKQIQEQDVLKKCHAIKTKIERANMQILKLSAISQVEDLVKKDIPLNIICDKNKQVLSQLADLVSQNPTAAGIVKKSIEQAGLPNLPARQMGTQVGKVQRKVTP